MTTTPSPLPTVASTPSPPDPPAAPRATPDGGRPHPPAAPGRRSALRRGAFRGRVLLLAALLAALTVVPASGREEGAGGPVEPESPPKTVGSGEAGDGVRVRGASRMLQRIWWNQDDMVESLQLREAQRAEMDRLLLEFLERRQTAAREALELRRRLADEAGAGRWEAAEATAAALAEARGDLGAAEAELVVEVVKRLDDRQRAALVERYPRLLSVPWIRANPASRLRSAPVAPGRRP